MQFEALVITQLVGIIVSVLTILFITSYFARKVDPFTRLIPLIESFSGDEKSQVRLNDALDSLIYIGASAKILYGMFEDEESYTGFITLIAQKAVKIFQMSMLGVKSGDSRREAKAEELVQKAMIRGAKELSPAIGIALKVTGLDEELEKDPEMFGYIIQAVQDAGLLNMFQQTGGSLAVPATSENKTDTTGIDA